MTTPVALPLPRRLDDRLNPILVKEVRQALRGRFFRWMFGLTLLVTTFAGLMVVSVTAMSGQPRIGEQFFYVIYACMGAAVLIFVPFSAFLSTSAEWDENTHDLLVLSNLGPRQIVWGKLFSALIQALLYYSTFTPFLVAAFLLNGLDLLAAGVVLVCSVATCIALSLLGIALAGLTHVRALRGFLMAFFGAGLTVTWGGSIGMVNQVVSQAQELRTDEGQTMVGVYVMTVLLVGALSSVIAMARFSHEEENRSTPMRILSLVLLAVAGFWAAWIRAMVGSNEPLWGLQIAIAHPLLLMWIFFLTEPEELGRRTLKWAQAHPRLALLALPLLPGGGRGVLLFLVHALLALGTTAFLHFLGKTPSGERLEALLIVASFYAYCFVYLALPIGLARHLWKDASSRILLRVGLVILWPLLLFVPVLIGLLFGLGDWVRWEHPFNPYWVAIEISQSGGPRELVPYFLLLLALGLVTFVLNAARLVRGVREPFVQARRAPPAQHGS